VVNWLIFQPNFLSAGEVLRNLPFFISATSAAARIFSPIRFQPRS
jgi:hypothetical protein